MCEISLVVRANCFGLIWRECGADLSASGGLGCLWEVAWGKGVAEREIAHCFSGVQRRRKIAGTVFFGRKRSHELGGIASDLCGNSPGN